MSTNLSIAKVLLSGREKKKKEKEIEIEKKKRRKTRLDRKRMKKPRIRTRPAVDYFVIVLRVTHNQQNLYNFSPFT